MSQPKQGFERAQTVDKSIEMADQDKNQGADESGLPDPNDFATQGSDAEVIDEVVVKKSNRCPPSCVTCIKRIFWLCLLAATIALFAHLSSNVVSDSKDGMDRVLPDAPAIRLDNRKNRKLQAVPKGYEIDTDLLDSFSYRLPRDFTRNGTSQLRAIEGYYDNMHLEGLRFTFSNNTDEIETRVFGYNFTSLNQLAQDGLERKKFYLGEAVTEVNVLMINTQLTPQQEKHAGWGMVHFGVNKDPTMRIGQDDADLADWQALRDKMRSRINAQKQRIIGVHGFTLKETGRLRAINFIVSTKEAQKLL